MNHEAEHSFSSLQCEHTDLERVFEKPQRALLPLYKTKGGEVEGGTLPIFQAEHRKLREIVARLARHTAGL